MKLIQKSQTMKVQFIKNFRDSKDKKTNKLGKSYLTLTVADFPKKRAEEIIKKGYARPLKAEDKNAEPTTLENK